MSPWDFFSVLFVLGILTAIASTVLGEYQPQRKDDSGAAAPSNSNEQAPSETAGRTGSESDRID